MIRQSTFPNLMDTHPPGVFQIDGNLGAANGMLEALVQSRWTPDVVEVELLPSLPQQWAKGSVEGLRVRGGASMDMRWENGKVTSLKLHATSDAAIRLIAPAGQAITHVVTSAGQTHPVGPDPVMHLKSGTSYDLAFR
jgi:alpha-L-fucosidase 2